MKHLILTLVLFSSVMFAGQAHALRVIDGEYIYDKLEDYNMCQNEAYFGDYCQDALNRWLEENPEDRWQAAKMTRLRMNHWVSLPYFYNAMDHESWSCEDEDLHLAVESALQLPPDAEEVIGQAKEIAFEHCFTEMEQKLLDLRSESYAFNNICVELGARDLLSEYQAKKCDRDASGEESEEAGEEAVEEEDSADSDE